ncbi:MAG: cysteine desulfurase family protein [Treponema sp.]
MEKIVYADYNATTPMDSEVKKVFIEALDYYANASSMHEDGRNVAKKIEEAREKVARLINAESDEIIFTSGGSESNNTVFSLTTSPILTQTSSNKAKWGGRKRVITTRIEHPCVMESAKHLMKQGIDVVFLPVDSYGLVDVLQYKKLIDESNSTEDPQKKILLSSIMMANNEIGTIEPIKEMAKLAKENGILFHTDGVQAVGKIPVDVKELDVDYMTISCHKIYGPKGIGALYVRRGCPIDSLIKGGHQERGLRAGTYNAPSIIAFGRAAELAKENLTNYMEHTGALRQRFIKKMQENIPNIHINGHPEKNLPNTVNISFPGAEGESILLRLDLAGIRVSTGSACASGSLESSHVLLATGVNPEAAHGSIRFSFGRYSTEEDVDYIASTMPEIISWLRSFSTLDVK